MKKIHLLLALTVALAACNNQPGGQPGSQPSANVHTPDSNAVIVTMERMGDLVIDTPKQAVEQLLRQKLAGLSSDSSAVYFPDTVSCRYKGVDYLLTFQKKQDYDDSNFTVTLAHVESRDARLKTSTGVGIGDSLSAIQKAYGDSDLTINIAPESEGRPAETTKVKGTLKVSVYVYERGNSIVFYLTDYKVRAMEVNTHIEGD